MKILITGAAGFIGSNLMKSLSEDHEVIGIDNMFRGVHYNGVEKADITGDISKYLKGVDIVYHLAAMSSVRVSEENPEKCFFYNVYGTYNLAKACADHGVKKIIFSSSREVYGDADKIPVSESAELKPKNVYGCSKVLGERIIRNICENSGMKFTIFRISNVYGPGDQGRIIPLLISKAMDGSELKIFGGGQVIDFIHISDVVAAMKDYSVYNKIINLGSGSGTKMDELIGLVEKITGKKMKRKTVPANPYEVMRFSSDISEISKLGFKPETNLEKGIKDLYERMKG
jgi:UDP-glucose 4-epimerase